MFGGLGLALAIFAGGSTSSVQSGALPSAAMQRAQAAIENIRVLQRPGKDGYATIWDGDKYVQCVNLKGGGLRCEAAGAAMQPSLARVLDAAHVARLGDLGWRLDPHFGNYVRAFSAQTSSEDVASAVLRTLVAGYDADVAAPEVETRWVDSEPCPPRNGFSQNLAGMVDDAPGMRAFLLHACAFEPDAQQTSIGPAVSAEALVACYGRRVTAEVQRLRVNDQEGLFFVLQAGIGYVQCAAEPAPKAAIYCEAQSPDSWPALSSVLTPDRLAKLHTAGYADPGRAPNYSKTYLADAFDDAAIARELITLLHDAYGYDGASPLTVQTEAGPTP